MICQVLFFLVFWTPRTSHTVKIEPKRCNGVQTCLSMGTGSAFKRIKRKSIARPQPQHYLNSPSNGKTWKEQAKQISSTCLAFHVVFGRACGAASTTFQIEKTRNPTSNQDSETTPNKLLKPLQKWPQMTPKWSQKWSRNGPGKGIRHQKIPEN